MFRLSREETRRRSVLTVDGQLSGEGLDLIERCCDEEMAQGRPVDLCLRDVTALDPAGRALLSRLAARGVHLIGRGLYTSFVVESVRSAGLRRRRGARASS